MQVFSCKEEPKPQCNQDRGEEGNPAPVFSVTSRFLMQRNEACLRSQFHRTNGMSVGRPVVFHRWSTGNEQQPLPLITHRSLRRRLRKGWKSIRHVPSSWAMDAAKWKCELHCQREESLVWHKEQHSDSPALRSISSVDRQAMPMGTQASLHSRHLLILRLSRIWREQRRKGGEAMTLY